jgi:hypothetical protein
MEQEKIYYYERKVEELDVEMMNLKRLQSFYLQIVQIYIPRFESIIDRRMVQSDVETEE